MCRYNDNRSIKDRVPFKAFSINAKRSSTASPESRKRTIYQRRVSFSSEESVKEIASSATDSWYSKTDIVCFQMQIRSVLMGLIKEEETTFGMERYGSERRLQRKTALRHIVLSQKVKKDPEFQRYISRQRTSASKATALNLALENYCEVYEPLSSLVEGGDDLFCTKDTAFNVAMIDQSC